MGSQLYLKKNLSLALIELESYFFLKRKLDPHLCGADATIKSIAHTVFL